MPARLGILLSGNGSTYANLVAAQRRGELPADFALVVSSRPDAGGLDLARDFGHPTLTATSPTAVAEALRDHGVEWVAMCGYMKFWDPPEDFRGRVLNIHPSLLPAFGGKGMYGIHVHRAVLAAGRRITGCTVHLVSGGYDSGTIIAQATVPVRDGDSAESLQERVQAAERRLYPQAVAALVGGCAQLDHGSWRIDGAGVGKNDPPS